MIRDNFFYSMILSFQSVPCIVRMCMSEVITILTSSNQGIKALVWGLLLEDYIFRYFVTMSCAIEDLEVDSVDVHISTPVFILP